MNWLKYCVVVCGFLVSCGGRGELDSLLDGDRQDLQRMQAVFSSASLRDMADVFEARLGRGAEWYGSATNALRLRTMVQAMCAQPGGTERAVSVFSAWMGKKVPDRSARRILGATAETNGAALMALIRSMDFQSPPAILPELIAVLANASQESLHAEFCSLLKGYDVAPRLFEPAFAAMSMSRFHAHMDVAKSELKTIALRRIREEWGAAAVRPHDHAAVSERVRFFTAAGTPMLAVLFVEIMAEDALRSGSMGEAVRRKTVEHLYGLTEGLKERIESRSEEEKMLYASIMARLYRAR